MAEADQLPSVTPSSKHGGVAVYQALTLALVAANGLLLWRLVELRENLSARPAGADPAGVRRVVAQLSKPDPSRAGTGARPAPQYVVLYVFTLQDCPPCLEELRNLNRVAEIRNDAAVYAIAGGATHDESRQTMHNFATLFPIQADPSGTLLKSLHVPQTPWKITFSTSKSRIIYEDPPGVTAEERQAFLDRVSGLPR